MQYRIKKIRKNANLTQKEFAQTIGIAQNTVAGYETGIRIPRGSVIKMICQKFNVNEDWLRYGTDEPYMDLPEANLESEKSPLWETVQEIYRKLTPKNRELWIKNGFDLLENENLELLEKLRVGLDFSLSDKIEQKNKE